MEMNCMTPELGEWGNNVCSAIFVILVEHVEFLSLLLYVLGKVTLASLNMVTVIVKFRM